MAKSYEVAFRVSAQLGGAFSTTFSAAQKQLTEVHAQITKLNKAQSDISGYQRQQASIDKTANQLGVYKEQLRITQEGLERLRQSESYSIEEETRLSAKQVELTNRIANTEAALASKNSRLQEMGERLSAAGVDVSDLSAESARLSGEMQELAAWEQTAAENAQGLGDRSAAFSALGDALVASGIVKGLQELADAYAECVAVSMEFSAAMSTVEALSGATAQQVAELTVTAQRLGADTAYTSAQVAEAMTYMGMAGWDASEMMSGIDGVISLAAASGEDLATVSDIVTDNLTAFGLSASDTAHFVDVLAAAASNSNTSVSIMGETFSGSAAIAGALGYSIEDVAVAVGLMANAGVKGSVAGTALKNTFNGLLEGATLTAAAFGEVEYSAINADGTIDSFTDAIDELRGYFGQMTDAERVQNAMLIAGQRGYNGLLAILNSTEADYASLTDEIGSCSGAAQRMADVKLDNLQGDVTLLNSAVDGLRNTVGGLFEDELRSAAQIGTEIITAVNEFLAQNPAVAKGLTVLAAGIGAMTAAYFALVAIKKAKNALDTVGLLLTASNTAATVAQTTATAAETTATVAAAAAQGKLNLAMLANPAVIITASVVALVAAVVALREACKLQELETMELSTATQEQYDEVDRLNSEYERACEVYGETSDEARALKYDLDEATAAIDGQTFSVSELYSRIDEFSAAAAEMRAETEDAAEAARQQQEDAQVLAAKLKDIASSSDTAARKEALMLPIVERLNELYPQLGLTVGNVAEQLDGLSSAIAAVGESSLAARYETAQSQLADLLVQEAEAAELAKQAEATYNAASARFAAAAGDNWGTALIGTINGTATQAQAEMHTAMDYLSTARQELAQIREQIEECTEVAEMYADVVSSGIVVSAYDAMSIAIDNVSEETAALIEAYREAYQAAYDSVSGQYSLWEQAEETIPTSIASINEALEAQADYWHNYTYNLDALKARTGDIEGLAEVIASFADGSSESVNAVAGLAEASDEELRLMVDNYRQQQAAQEEVAAALAQYQVDIGAELDGIVDDMAAAIAGMDMSDEARDSAAATMDAYAQAILEGKDSAVEAALVVAAASAAALSGAETTSADSIYYSGAETTSADSIYYSGATSSTAVWDAITSAATGLVSNAYAGGTGYAAAGLALVGEDGPEIVRMRGGEQVINAEDTRSLLSGGGMSVTIAPSFTVNGSANDDDIRGMADTIIELVREGLEDAAADRRRSVYA